MIARLRGVVLESTPLQVVLDIGGVGYEVHIPVTTAEKLPPSGREATLFIHAVYREDSAALYGFAERRDRDFFRLLVERVSGIGPKIAIGILSRLSAELLESAIGRSDVALLAKCPGIGKKTAERLVIELKDKFVPGEASGGSAGEGGQPTAGGGAGAAPSPYQDAVASLITLGYKPADADKLVRKAASKLGENADVEALVRGALA